MSVEYYYMNDLKTLYNAAVGDKTDGGEHHVKMMEAHDNLEAHIQRMEHWKDTALQLSRNNGETQAKIKVLEADYVISNRELLVKQVEIDRLTAELAALRDRTRWTDCDNTMIVRRDGGAWCFTLPDFINLVVSPAVFTDDGDTGMDAIYAQLKPEPPEATDADN